MDRACPRSSSKPLKHFFTDLDLNLKCGQDVMKMNDLGCKTDMQYEMFCCSLCLICHIMTSSYGHALPVRTISCSERPSWHSNNVPSFPFHGLASRWRAGWPLGLLPNLPTFENERDNTIVRPTDFSSSRWNSECPSPAFLPWRADKRGGPYRVL